MPLDPQAVRRRTDPAAAASLTEGNERRSAGRRRARRPGSPTASPLLASALAQESDPRVREAIFTGLARIATAESAAAVVPYLRSDDASLRTGAIDALRAMPQAASRHLPPSARRSRCRRAPAELRACARPAGRRRPTGCCATCSKRETEKNVCAAAVEVLAEIGRPEALPSLTRCATRFDGDPFIAFSIKVAIDRIVAAPARRP